jgi:hypothetical protein
MKKLLFAFLLSLCFGCATTIPDRVTRLSSFEVSHKTILVQPFEFDPNIATNVEKAFVKDFGKEIAIDLLDLLHKESSNTKSLLAEGTDEKADLLIKGVITQVEGGNKHQRIWLGFGYGASIVSARGEVVDLKTSKTLMRFYITKKSNWTYSSSEAAVRENLQEIAQEIANSICHSN